jgi:hypothetical protein
MISTAIFAQPSPPKADLDAIKSMCGCYSITFDYAEVFPSDPSYEVRDPYHAEARAEWIFVVEEEPGRVALQHLLIVDEDRVIKHWRQDWVYENTDQYLFDKDNKWRYNRLSPNDVRSQWTQKVFQVDDSPRYEGTATWIHADGRHYWESMADSPLPRREYTKRSDYNVMQRTNRHILTDYGWLHEQDNFKIIREETGDSILVAEKGLNKYNRIDDSHCQAAREWWDKHAAYWDLVRDEWDIVFSHNEDLSLRSEVKDKVLWKALFDLEKDLTSVAQEKSAKVRKQIRKVIKEYTIPVGQSANG